MWLLFTRPPNRQIKILIKFSSYTVYLCSNEQYMHSMHMKCINYLQIFKVFGYGVHQPAKWLGKFLWQNCWFWSTDFWFILLLRWLISWSLQFHGLHFKWTLALQLICSTLFGYATAFGFGWFRLFRPNKCLWRGVNIPSQTSIEEDALFCGACKHGSIERCMTNHAG